MTPADSPENKCPGCGAFPEGAVGWINHWPGCKSGRINTSGGEADTREDSEGREPASVEGGRSPSAATTDSDVKTNPVEGEN